MPIISLKTGTKSRSLLVGNTAFNPSSYESIASTTLTSSNTTITFNSIPSTYQHLQIRALAKTTITSLYGSDIIVRFNGTAGTSYATHSLIGDGSTATGDSLTNIDGVYVRGSVMDDASSQTDMWGVSIIDIHDYASTTKNKTVRAFAGIDGNTSNSYYKVALSSGVYLSTSAVSSITIVATGGGTYKSGSTFALYGIKGA